EREPRFSNLAPECLLPARELLGEEVPGQLHGDGAGAGSGEAVEQVVPNGADDPANVHPFVLEEAAILDGDEGEGYIRRKVRQRNELPALAVEETQQPAPGIVELRRLLRGEVLDLRGSRTAAGARVPPCPQRRTGSAEEERDGNHGHQQ